MERITSAKNPLIQHMRRLFSSRSYREKCGEFAAEGWKLLEEALRWYPELTVVLLSEQAQLPSLPDGVRVAVIPETLMQSVSPMPTPQGVAFAMRLPQNATAELQNGMLLLDRIQDPGNLGTILRTADAFEIPVALTNGCADPYSEKTLRASMGAVFRTPPQSIPLQDVLEAAHMQRICLTATALTPAAQDIRHASLRDTVVVIGSEGQGICPALLEASTKQVIIPMSPRCESLNAAIAAGLVLWQMKQ